MPAGNNIVRIYFMKGIEMADATPDFHIRLTAERIKSVTSAPAPCLFKKMPANAFTVLPE